MSISLHDYEVIKLDILHSLARSQRALATMMEHLAELSHFETVDSDHLAKQMTSMSIYQRRLAEHLLQIRLRHMKKGQHKTPWINIELGICNPASTKTNTLQ